MRTERNQLAQGHRKSSEQTRGPGDMFRPGTWGKDEVIDAGPIGNPDSGETGQGKEIGDQEVTQT